MHNEIISLIYAKKEIISLIYAQKENISLIYAQKENVSLIYATKTFHKFMKRTHFLNLCTERNQFP